MSTKKVWADILENRPIGPILFEVKRTGFLIKRAYSYINKFIPVRFANRYLEQVYINGRADHITSLL